MTIIVEWKTHHAFGHFIAVAVEAQTIIITTARRGYQATADYTTFVREVRVQRTIHRKAGGAQLVHLMRGPAELVQRQVGVEVFGRECGARCQELWMALLHVSPRVTTFATRMRKMANGLHLTKKFL